MNETELLKNAKPILFNSEMVRAILTNKKTQTRRVVKLQPQYHPNGDYWLTNTDYWYAKYKPKFETLKKYSKYQPGDILYVRETWANIRDWVDVDPDVGMTDGYIYKANWRCDEHPKWRPSIHMPKVAARIILEITDIKIERLQDITSEEAIAEGMGYLCFDEAEYDKKILAVIQFEYLWDKIYLKRGLGWSTNPFVWVIEFDVKMERFIYGLALKNK